MDTNLVQKAVFFRLCFSYLFVYLMVRIQYSECESFYAEFDAVLWNLLLFFVHKTNEEIFGRQTHRQQFKRHA